MKRIAVALALAAGVGVGLTVGGPASGQLGQCLPGSTDPNYCQTTTTTGTTTTGTTTTGTTTTGTTTTGTTTNRTTTTGTTTGGTTTGGAANGNGSSQSVAQATLANGVTVASGQSRQYSHIAVAGSSATTAHAAADGTVVIPGIVLVCHGGAGRECLAKVRFDDPLGLRLKNHGVPGYKAGYTRATLGRLHYGIPSGTSEPLRLRLSHRGRFLIRKHGKLSGNLVVLLHGADGAFTPLVRSATISRP